MKICFVSHASNYHTRKWANWFRDRGHEVHVISFAFSDVPGVNVHSLSSNVSESSNDVQKLAYLSHGKQFRRLINEIKPDIINVHYASSYGALAAISGIKGYILSVWGSDVYEFPQKSCLHRQLLKYSLHKAGYLFSTSEAMATEASKYTDKLFTITPFGVDMNLFNPDKRVRGDDNKYIVGTVKALKPKYGIDKILRSVARVREIRPDIPIELRIAGKGEYEEQYKALAEELGIDSVTTWLGFIHQDSVAFEWANMDVAIIPSATESESFGVSAVEAEACGTPVIISDIPGLMEATSPGETSIVVPRNNCEAIAKQLINLYDHPDKRCSIGQRGRLFVQNRFEIDKCFKEIEEFYDRLINL